MIKDCEFIKELILDRPLDIEGDRERMWFDTICGIKNRLGRMLVSKTQDSDSTQKRTIATGVRINNLLDGLIGDCGTVTKDSILFKEIQEIKVQLKDLKAVVVE